MITTTSHFPSVNYSTLTLSTQQQTVLVDSMFPHNAALKCQAITAVGFKIQFPKWSPDCCLVLKDKKMHNSCRITLVYTSFRTKTMHKCFYFKSTSELSLLSFFFKWLRIILCFPDLPLQYVFPTVFLHFKALSAAFLNWLAMCSGSAGLFSLTPKQEMGIRGWKVRGRTAWQIEPGWWKGQRWEGHFLADFYPSINTIHHLVAINTHE